MQITLQSQLSLFFSRTMTSFVQCFAKKVSLQIQTTPKSQMRFECFFFVGFLCFCTNASTIKTQAKLFIHLFISASEYKDLLVLFSRVQFLWDPDYCCQEFCEVPVNKSIIAVRIENITKQYPIMIV